MTKYYYKNQLIRTSKTHANYTHAVIQEWEGKIAVLACRSSEDGASKELNSFYNYHYGSRIENKENKINAIKKGKKYFIAKDGRKTFKIEINNKDSIEEEIAKLESLQDSAKRFLECTSVVEIEAR